jgi:hypothetical protein
VLTSVHGVDSLTRSLIYSGESLWFLGYPDKALETCAKALERAEAANHPYSIAYAQMGSCAVRFFRREPEAIEDAEAFAQSAFVDEDDGGALLAVRFFLI